MGQEIEAMNEATLGERVEALVMTTSLPAG